MRKRKQKKRVQYIIRKWYIKRVQIKIFNDELGLYWDAIWRGMRAECARETGLALSTINRYWQGAIAINGEILDCYDVIEKFGIKLGIKVQCPYERVKAFKGGFNIWHCKEGHSPYMLTWGWPSDGYHKTFYDSLSEALEDNDDLLS